MVSNGAMNPGEEGKETVPVCSHAEMLATLDAACGQALQAALRNPDMPVAGIAAQGVLKFRAVVAKHWPLPPEQRDIFASFGPFVAKNIDDWNEPLGNMLHALIACVREEGRGVEELKARIAMMARESPPVSGKSL